MKNLFLSILVLAGMITARSQWNPDTGQNVKVVDTNSEVFGFPTAMSDGKTYVTYWKKVNAPVNYELWLQILDQNGNKQLGNNGIMISNQIPMSTYFAVEGTAIDSSDNLYIGVTGTGAGNAGYVFKITPQGNSVWPNGIMLGEAALPKILPLSGGDIMVAYAPITQKYTKVQRFNSNGQAVWQAPVDIKSDDLSKETNPVGLFKVSDNEYEIIFNQSIGGTNAYLFAQKINHEGTILWNAPKQVSTKVTSSVGEYNSIVVDGTTVYCAYIGSDNNALYGYLQKINSDGTLPWGADGVNFTTDPSNFQLGIKAAMTPGAPHVWAIAHYANPSQNLGGEFVQKFDKNTGARLLTNTAKQIYPIDSSLRHHAGNLYLINDNPFFIIQKNTDPNSNAISLNVVSLNNSGDFSWAQEHFPMATYPAAKSGITSLAPVNGQNVIVFHEKKASDSEESIYAQNFKFSALNTQETQGNQLSDIIYPNPAKDVISIKGMKDQKYEIYNTTGQLIQSGNIKDSKISVQNLLKGVYYLKIKDRNHTHTFSKE
ncbi:T9SS type A sorting domain-containing protein [Chryseobacterium sp. P1-3]|uniref:T9SS type A sorting domain-containing protein n=1 Tax=Chryseobacterium sp. (strain P1-3) TaxID=1517683 RepID=UPI0006793475|nr:T9SS type A sorting domain-containing protein [Chryseobacterium sp. P1-3]